MFFYKENEHRNSNFDFNPNSFDAVKQYATHFGNLMYLNFVSLHSDTSPAEKKQAETETTIANRKIKFWKNIAERQKLDEAIAAATAEIKKQWK